MITTKTFEFMSGFVLVFIISGLFIVMTNKWWHRLLVIILAGCLLKYIGDDCSAKFPEFCSCPQCNQIIYPVKQNMYGNNIFVVENVTYRNYYCERCDKFVRIKEVLP